MGGLGSTLAVFEGYATRREIPDELSLSSFEASEIKRVAFANRDVFIVLDSGEVYVTGLGEQAGWGLNGLGHNASTSFEKITSEKFNSEKVIDVVVDEINSDGVIFLTDKGNLYGFGRKDLIGMGNLSDIVYEPEKIEGISNVKSIVGGKGFFVCILNDGRVFGTGSNKYGILGRWRYNDANRSYSNSRYRTAFEFVECSDLEI